MNGEAELVRVSMLGGFRIQSGVQQVSESRNRARLLWNLLEYLVAFRHRDVPQEELIGVLWQDDEIDNPSGALKNLVYRIRTVLSSQGIPQAKKMILCRRGAYSWNNGLPTVVDVEEFERLVQKADGESGRPREQLTLYLEAISLYKGDFLPKSASEEWVTPLSTYYRGLYVKCVEQTARLLTDAGRYQEIVDIAQQALVIDQFEEGFHAVLLRALTAMEAYPRAMAHYERVNRLFYRELGVKPSEDLQQLYQELVQNTMQPKTDLETIKKDLRETSLEQGAFFCEYDVFKNIYQLKARIAERTGQSVFLLLLTAAGAEGEPLSPKLLSSSMDRLQDCLLQSLRRSDVAARCSATQFVAMLSSLTQENGLLVQQRILNRFQKENVQPEVCIQFRFQPMEPMDGPPGKQKAR